MPIELGSVQNFAHILRVFEGESLDAELRVKGDTLYAKDPKKTSHADVLSTLGLSARAEERTDKREAAKQFIVQKVGEHLGSRERAEHLLAAVPSMSGGTLFSANAITVRDLKAIRGQMSIDGMRRASLPLYDQGNSPS